MSNTWHVASIGLCVGLACMFASHDNWWGFAMGIAIALFTLVTNTSPEDWGLHEKPKQNAAAVCGEMNE